MTPTWTHRGRPAEQLALTDGHLERITAGDVRPGDRIARTRTSPISTVRRLGPAGKRQPKSGWPFADDLAPREVR